MTFPATRTGDFGSKWSNDLLRLTHRRWFQRSGFLAALVGALLFQSGLVGAHVHPAEPLAVSAASADAGSAPSSPQDNAPQKSCLLCDQGALDGHGLIPDPVDVVFVASTAPLVAIPASAPLDVASISHLWQSRAPPQ